jgi:hypothetical protein
VRSRDLARCCLVWGLGLDCERLRELRGVACVAFVVVVDVDLSLQSRVAAVDHRDFTDEWELIDVDVVVVAVAELVPVCLRSRSRIFMFAVAVAVAVAFISMGDIFRWGFCDGQLRLVKWLEAGACRSPGFLLNSSFVLRSSIFEVCVGEYM